MKKMSDKYFDAVKSSLVQDISYDMEINIGLLDTKAMKNADNNDRNNAVPYTGDKRLFTLEDNPVSKYYATFEKDFYRLDDDRLMLYEAPPANTTEAANSLPEKPDDYQGYISKEICGCLDNRFNDELILLMSCNTRVKSIKGITLYFDTINGNYPTSIEVTTKMDDKIKTQYFNIDSPVAEIIPPADNKTLFENFVDISIRFCAMNKPFTRLRLSKVVLGTIKTFTSDELIGGFTNEFDLDATNFRLPQQKMSFSVYSARDNGEFDPDNEDGLYSFVREGQPVWANLLVKDNSGNIIDRVPAGNMRVSGVSDNEKETTFNAVSYLQNADMPVSFNEEAMEITLYDLLTKEVSGKNGLFAKMDLPLTSDGKKRWIVDDSLKNVTTKAVIKDIKANELLRLIAQAGCCGVFEDDEGYIRVEPIKKPTSEATLSLEDDTGNGNNSDNSNNTVLAKDTYTFDNMFSVPTLNQYPLLKEVEVTWYNVINIKESDTQKIEFIQEKIEPVFYNHEGMIVNIDNILINSAGRAEAVAKFVGEQIIKRNEYTANIIGGVEIEAFDNIKTQSKYAINNSLVTKKTLKYNGAVNCDIKYFS